MLLIDVGRAENEATEEWSRGRSSPRERLRELELEQERLKRDADESAISRYQALDILRKYKDGSGELKELYDKFSATPDFDVKGSHTVTDAFAQYTEEILERRDFDLAERLKNDLERLLNWKRPIIFNFGNTKKLARLCQDEGAMVGFKFDKNETLKVGVARFINVVLDRHRKSTVSKLQLMRIVFETATLDENADFFCNGIARSLFVMVINEVNGPLFLEKPSPYNVHVIKFLGDFCRQVSNNSSFARSEKYLLPQIESVGVMLAQYYLRPSLQQYVRPRMNYVEVAYQIIKMLGGRWRYDGSMSRDNLASFLSLKGFDLIRHGNTSLPLHQHIWVHKVGLMVRVKVQKQQLTFGLTREYPFNEDGSLKEEQGNFVVDDNSNEVLKVVLTNEGSLYLIPAFHEAVGNFEGADDNFKLFMRDAHRNLSSGLRWEPAEVEVAFKVIDLNTIDGVRRAEAR